MLVMFEPPLTYAFHDSLMLRRFCCVVQVYLYSPNYIFLLAEVKHTKYMPKCLLNLSLLRASCFLHFGSAYLKAAIQNL